MVKQCRQVAIWIVVGAVAVTSGCRSPYYADSAAALGGLTGAVAGAALGDHDGNAAAGAVVGGAVGALTGAVIGDSIDRHDELIAQRLGRRLTGAVTISDVVAMSREGVGDSVIITHIRSYGVAQSPQAGDVIAMHQQGVSEAVINAMQQAASQPPVVVPVGGRPPVIVEEHYYGPPCYPPWGYHYRPCPPRHRGGVSWGVTFRG